MDGTDNLGETIRLVLARIDDPSNTLAIEGLCVGVFFTGVKLNSGHAGVAFTPVGEIPEAVCCPRSAVRMPDAGNLTQKPIDDILACAMSSNVLKSAIGVATINALSAYLFEKNPGGDYGIEYGQDGLEFLPIGPDDAVCLVGAFTPYIRRFKNHRGPFFVIEKTAEILRPDEKKYYRPPADIPRVLPDSDVVIITGAAIVNHTLDGLVGQTRPDSRVAVIGPTASMAPDVYFRNGVDLMAGIRVVDPDLMLRIIEEGGSGYHLYARCAERVTYIKSKPASDLDLHHTR